MKKLFHSLLGAFILLPLTLSTALGISLDTFSQDVYRPENLPGGRTGDAAAETKIIEVLDFVVRIVLYASGSVAVLIIVISAVKIILSFGIPEEMEKGKKWLKNALLGLIAVILAYAIVTNVIDLIFRATT